MLLSGPHYIPGEEEDDEDDLEYETDTPSKGSYTTLPSTGGCSKPSPQPTCSPTLEDSNPKTNAVLWTAELEAHIRLFLEEVEEDMELDNLPPLENVTPLPILAPTISGFIPFAISTSQRCIPPRSLLRKVYHPYKDPVGQCCCEPGGWCNNLPCSSQIWLIPHKIRGCGSLNGGTRSGRSCCGTLEEPFNQLGSSCGQRTPTCAPCSGSLELWAVGGWEGGQRSSSIGSSGGIGDGLFWGLYSQVIVWQSDSRCQE